MKLSELRLTPEETTKATGMKYTQLEATVIDAQLQKLKDRGDIYVKVDCPECMPHNKEMVGWGYCRTCYNALQVYAPLSELEKES